MFRAQMALTLSVLGLAAAMSQEPTPLQPKAVVPHDENFYSGKVTKLTAAAIVIDCPDGRVRTIRMNEPLAAGRLSPRSRPSCYKLTDVKVGDVVSLDVTVYTDKSEECYAIRILRRPGGRVPPSPGNQSLPGRGFHDRMNALQDFEEKGIPLPEHFRPRTPAEMDALEVKWKAEREAEQKRTEQLRREREAAKKPPEPAKP